MRQQRTEVTEAGARPAATKCLRFQVGKAQEFTLTHPSPNQGRGGVRRALARRVQQFNMSKNADGDKRHRITHLLKIAKR